MPCSGHRQICYTLWLKNMSTLTNKSQNPLPFSKEIPREGYPALMTTWASQLKTFKTCQELKWDSILAVITSQLQPALMSCWSSQLVHVSLQVLLNLITQYTNNEHYIIHPEKGMLIPFNISLSCQQDFLIETKPWMINDVRLPVNREHVGHVGIQHDHKGIEQPQGDLAIY